MAWTPLEAPVEAICELHAEPLMALVNGAVPAFVLRDAYPREHCTGLMQRFEEQGLLYDPRQAGEGKPHRVDIGTSFGSHRADRNGFHAHAAQTKELFSRLFEGFQNPVQLLYDVVGSLAPRKKVMTAREPDGREYGPAIFRIYHEDLGHGPHYDSVRKRTKATDYEVAHFDHQFAAVLCLQNSADEGACGEPHLYNRPWTPELQERLKEKTFAELAEQEQIEKVQLHLEPGDLYLFFSENFHEVPAVSGDRPRAVLAIFFAMSADREEIFVWS